MAPRIVLMAGRGPYAAIVHNALLKEHPDLHVMLDGPVSRWATARRRARSQGWFAVLGQIAFMLLVNPVLRRLGRKRIAEIAAEAGLDDTPIPTPVPELDSVDSETARKELRRLQPKVVVVCATRLLSKKTLGAVNAPFINFHQGISPAFRGVHGAYWALTMARPDLAGTTIHVVDRGIDTGRILKQGVFAVTSRDNFATYPYLHLAVGIPLLKQAIRETLNGPPVESRVTCDLPSALWFQPTAWGYVWRRLRKGVR